MILCSHGARRLGASFSIASLTLLAGNATDALAQSFGVDDNPSAPLVGFPGPGSGAEDPFGPTGWGPSPVLNSIGYAGGGTILSPVPGGPPFIQGFVPGFFYVSSFSSNHDDNGQDVTLRFSVDRNSFGDFEVANQANLFQAPGDVFETTHTFRSPGSFVGILPPFGFFGPLGALSGGFPGNVLVHDDLDLGLGSVFGAADQFTPLPLPPNLIQGSHDNLDSYDLRDFDANGDGLTDIDIYFTLYPADANFAFGSAADILVVRAGEPGWGGQPAFAPHFMMGLDAGDSIDGLVVFDVGAGPEQGAEPQRDYALFSLAPGSVSLIIFGLDPGMVFFTDFNGSFGVYAETFDIGIFPGGPFPGPGNDNVDALELVQDPIGPCGFVNPSFETGDFTGWLVQDLLAPFDPLRVDSVGGAFFPLTPTDGNFAAHHGFDGDGFSSGFPIKIAQDVVLNDAGLHFDWRGAWDNFGFLDRKFDVVIRPSGGGLELARFNVLTASAGSFIFDTGPQSSFINLSPFKGQAVQVCFEWTIPEDFTGPAQFQLDNVCLKKFCLGDANMDCVVDFGDITDILGNWLSVYLPGTGLGDANGDGVVDFGDMTDVLGNWLAPCP